MPSFLQIVLVIFHDPLRKGEQETLVIYRVIPVVFCDICRNSWTTEKEIQCESKLKIVKLIVIIGLMTNTVHRQLHSRKKEIQVYCKLLKVSMFFLFCFLNKRLHNDGFNYFFLSISAPKSPTNEQ